MPAEVSPLQEFKLLKGKIAFMKNFLIRILLAAAFTLLTFAVASFAQAQQAAENSAPTTPHTMHIDGLEPQPTL